MTARLLSVGLWTPPARIPQEQACAQAALRCALTERQAHRLARFYQGAQVRARDLRALREGETLYADASPRSAGPGTGRRNAFYARHAPPLAQAAAQAALAQAQLPSRAVTHLITASCTGFEAPGVDLSLLRALGLSRSVERLHLGFMGCHAAVNALRAARAIVLSDPACCALVCCVEVCSAHLQYGWDAGAVVASALFADGAAAALVAHEDRAPPRAPRLAAGASALLVDDPDAMRWTISDHGFVMTLSPKVPEMIERTLRPWLASWLGEQGLDLGDVASWAVHPGGPRVLDAVAAALDLPPQALTASRRVLRERGNMSSATTLHILEELLRRKAPPPCLLLGFGPGLWAEALLLR